MADKPVVIPIEVNPAIAARIKEALAGVAPGKRGKITLALDQYGTLTASLGAKAKVKGFEITIGAFGGRSADGQMTAGVGGSIEFEPAP